MRQEELKGEIVEFYECPKDMPMQSYQRFQQFLMIDNEVGSSFEDYNIRSRKLFKFLKSGMLKEATQETMNRNQAVFNCFNGYIPKGRAAAMLVYSINGVRCKDKSKEGLDWIIDKLEELEMPQSRIEKIIFECKKKLTTLWNCIFPKNSKAPKLTNTA